MNRFVQTVFLAVAVSLVPPAHANQVLLDHGVRAGGLWLFPISGRADEYRYLPYQARLAEDENGNPKFSYLQYVNDSSEASQQLSGGGVLHMLVEYYTPPAQIDRAQEDLRELLENIDATIVGPIIFDSGSYFVTSAILADEGRGFIGRAPVLEGNRVALAFDLDMADAALLGKSFEFDTPDISVSFDMTFSGLSDAYEATVRFDWNKVHSAMKASAQASYMFVSADIRAEVDKLVQDQTIQFESKGSGGNTEALVNRTYDRIVKMMFEPVPMMKMQESGSGDLVKLISEVVTSQARDAITKGVGGLHAGFRLTNIERQGTAELSFNHSETLDRAATIVFNVADIYAKYGSRPEFFRQVVIQSGPQRRDVRLMIDGEMQAEFDRLLNAVEVKLRKEHANGDVTSDQFVLTSADTEQSRFVYSRREGDLDDWLSYEYQVTWVFKGGGRLQEDWRAGSDSVVSLFTPYERLAIPVFFEPEGLKARGVRAVEVKLTYDFFDESRTTSLLIIPTRPQGDAELEVTLPRGIEQYTVDLAYTDASGNRKTSSSTTSSRVLFVENDI